MKELTAIKWLIEKLNQCEPMYSGIVSNEHKNYIDNLIKESLKLEREQHAKTWDAALDKYEVRAGNYMRAYEDFDDYYDELKQNKKRNFVFSDDQDLNLVKELNAQAMANSQFTISDDVLFEQAIVAMEEVYGYGCETEIDAYFRGAKWILKQINK